MNFEFSDDQLVMKEEVRKLFEKEDSVKRNRNILEGDENFDKDLWNKVVEMGLTAITIPEEHGGIGLGFLELCVVAEEMGRAIAPIPYSSSVYLATTAIINSSNDDVKKEYFEVCFDNYWKENTDISSEENIHKILDLCSINKTDFFI